MKSVPKLIRCQTVGTDGQKSMPKLIRRFAGIMLVSSLLLILLNFVLLALYMLGQKPNSHPWQTAQEVAEQLHFTQDGQEYILPEEMALELEQSDVWAVFIDNKTMKVVWMTDNLPKTVPLSYSASDIADLTRGYIDGYPTFTGEAENGLAVLGYPKESFWKHMWPSWDYDVIAGLPKTVLSVFFMNIVLIFIIYAAEGSRLLKAVKPIISGIQSLPMAEAVHIREQGVLSELAASINKTSEILQTQGRQLRKKETSRANWIAGVSHDIRTPLSMVMGYAGQLENDSRLPEDGRRKAAVIVRQSERMRNLINDLNLASKLEYNMQPLNTKRQNLVAIVRQAAVDFINMDIDDRHPIQWDTEETLISCLAEVDRNLIKRAVGNLIQNCISHNRSGCSIYVSVTEENGQCTIEVSDDGAGASDDQIEQLNHAPHYMVCDENTTQQRHGLGLLIVKQIAGVHGGRVVIGRSIYGGFCVRMVLPEVRNC